MRPRIFKRRRQDDSARPASIAFPYYVDHKGLRVLADSLAIELPTIRETKEDVRVSAQVQGIGAEGGLEEGRQMEGHIHLNDLAARLTQSAAFREIVDVLGQIPRVHDRGILDAAIDQIEVMPDDEVNESLSGRLQSAYETERIREVVSVKRQELEQAAAQNQLVILRGTFETVELGEETGCVRLSHLEPSEVIPENSDTPESQIRFETTEMSMPEDVGIETVLAAKTCLTDAGRERLARGAPFYGRMIGHSASYDANTGVLTCSAYAIWGMPKPVGLLDQPRDYDFLEAR